MSSRILLAAGFAAVALATGCSRDEGDDQSAGPPTAPSPTTEARRACVRGAGEIDEPLVTFS